MPANERGGPKPGAGRRPGSNFAQRTGAGAHRSTPVLTASQNPAVRIPPDDPVISQIVRLRCSGLSWLAIGRQTGHDAETCQRWVAAYPDVSDRIVRELTSAKDAVAPMVPDALAAIHELTLAADSDATRLTAARDVLDRRFGKPITTTVHEGLPQPQINIFSLTLAPEHDPEFRPADIVQD